MSDDAQLVRGKGISQLQRRQAWARIVDAWHHSGMSANAFAQQQGLRAKALFRWQWKLSRTSQPAQGAFQEVQSAPAAEDHPIAMQLHLGHVRLDVHRSCSPELLTCLIASVQEKSC